MCQTRILTINSILITSKEHIFLFMQYYDDQNDTWNVPHTAQTALFDITGVPITYVAIYLSNWKFIIRNTITTIISSLHI